MYGLGRSCCLSALEDQNMGLWNRCDPSPAPITFTEFSTLGLSPHYSSFSAWKGLSLNKWMAQECSASNWNQLLLCCCHTVQSNSCPLLSSIESELAARSQKCGSWFDRHGAAFSWIRRVPGYNGFVSLHVSSFPELTSLLSALPLWGRTRVVPLLPAETDSTSFSRAHISNILELDLSLPCLRAESKSLLTLSFTHCKGKYSINFTSELLPSGIEEGRNLACVVSSTRLGCWQRNNHTEPRAQNQANRSGTSQ